MRSSPPTTCCRGARRASATSGGGCSSASTASSCTASAAARRSPSSASTRASSPTRSTRAQRRAPTTGARCSRSASSGRTRACRDAIEVTRRIPDARLVVAGDPAMPLDEHLGAERVEWRLGYLPAVGARPRASRRRPSRSSRTARSSTSPGALLQALGAGVPAVVYDVAGLGEPIRAFGAGARRAGRRRRRVDRGRAASCSATPDALARARAGADARASRADVGRVGGAAPRAVPRARVIFRRVAVRDGDRRAARPVRARASRRDRGGRGAARARTTRAERDEAEELYGDYVDAVETGTELLADMRDHYARTLDDPDAVPARVQPGGREAAARRSRSRSRIGSDAGADRGLRARRRPADRRARRPHRARSTGCCFPRFDSSSCFGALLGTRENGRWLIAPDDGRPRDRRAATATNTLILESEWQTATGRVRVIDFMPPRETTPDIVRIVEGLEGRVEMRTELVIRLDYGSVIPWVRRARRRDAARDRRPGRARAADADRARAEGHDARRRLHRARGRARAVRAHVVPVARAAADAGRRRAGARATRRRSGASGWRGCRVPRRLSARRCTARCSSLKALTYEPTGGIVAAPTTSLPERIGGVRNWDYRYCWLRDATFTLYALMNAGFIDEARAWRDWLLRAVAGDPAKAQILYGVGGRAAHPRVRARLAARLRRLAAGAHRQRRARAVPARRLRRGDGRAAPGARARARPPTTTRGRCSRTLMDFLEGAWDQPDEGIWEVRGPRRHFTHSKVLAWVAFDRAVEAVERWDLPGPVDQLAPDPAEIHDEVCREGFNVELQRVHAVVRLRRARRVDAADPAPRLPAAATIRAWSGTIDAIQRDLTRDGFVERYAVERRNDVDGLPGGEGVFLPCSFWLVDALLMLERRRRGARAVRAAARRLERPRPALGGVRPGREAAARQLPAGVHARRPRQLGVQPLARTAARASSASRPYAAFTTSADLQCDRRALDGCMAPVRGTWRASGDRSGALFGRTRDLRLARRLAGERAE